MQKYLYFDVYHYCDINNSLHINFTAILIFLLFLSCFSAKHLNILNQDTFILETLVSRKNNQN